jgi:hypothetical protein
MREGEGWRRGRDEGRRGTEGEEEGGRRGTSEKKSKVN